MTDPDLNLLIALDALLGEASVAGAARRLGLSASAMSRTLARLREATGDALLVRAGRTMVLTPHAQAIRARSQATALEARALLRPSTDALDLASLRRSFTIRANDGFVIAFGAALVDAVARLAPQVQLCFVAKPAKTDTPLRQGSVDLEIGVLGGMGPEVRVQALFRDHFVGVVRPGHPLASLSEVDVACYTAFGHVVVSRHGRHDGPVDAALARLGAQRRIVAVVASFPAALAMALASDLIALLPASLLHQAAPAQLLQRPHLFELPVSTEQITVSQMWHPRLNADPGHRWLRALVRDVCQQRMPLLGPPVG